MKKLSFKIVGAVLLTAALIGGILCGFLRFFVQDTVYVIIDGREYDRTLEALDLSGQTVTEWDKLAQLTALKELDLRDTGLSIQEYDALRSALPGCQITWSVPFQDRFYDNTLTELTIDTLTEADVALLAYFPELTVIRAEECTDTSAIPLLMAQYPYMKVGCNLSFSGQRFHTLEAETLSIENPDLEELRRQLRCFPYVTDVYFTGTLPQTADLIQLQQELPKYCFIWDVDVLGVTASTVAETLDLTGVAMTDTQALEELLPCFYQLETVEMSGCGLDNETMADLNHRHPETTFVWTVNIGSFIQLRTDVTSFMPYNYGYRLTGADCANLRYCTEIIAMDFGHNPVGDISFLKDMPQVQYLLLGDTEITDLTPLSYLKELKYLEIFMTKTTDLWPLLNCTALKDLNLCYTKALDYTPLLYMTQLDRLWLAGCYIDAAGQAELQAALPHTDMIFRSDGSTNKGWRCAPGYFAQRDLFGLYYMTS